jgi:uncharacterized protein (TIGR03067 family)
MFRSALVLFALAAVVASAAPVPKDLKKQSTTLDGRWEVVEYHSNGRKVNSATAITWVIDGQNLSIERVNKAGGAVAKPANVSYTLVKPDGGSANALDYTYNYTANNIPPRTMPGVFEVDGDTLKFCYATAVGGERPAACEPAQGTLLYVFKKADAK